MATSEVRERPLEQRIYKSKAKVVLPPLAAPSLSCRPKAYALWTQESLDQAIAAVHKGTSIRRAADMFGVPRSTLHDHVSGKVEQFAKQGPKPYLNTEEEEELASFLVRCARIGYPHTRLQVLSIVQNIVNSKKLDVVITNGWWERFRQRHPYLTLRTAMPLSYARAMASDRDSIDRYYDLLEETLKTNGIYNDPTRIFNCDETGVPLNPKPLKVVGEKGAKNLCTISGNSKSQITVLACASAAGFLLPPFVIFDRKTLTKTLTKGEVPGSAYGLSSRGWMDMELFRDWFIGHFLSYTPSCRPLLLLLDGHSSHFCPEMMRVAAAEGVIIFALPPHTTHLSQPLDKGVFAPLKIEWRKTVQEFISKNPGRDITRYDFSALFKKAWNKAMSLPNLEAAFRVTGVCPFNRNAISLPSEEEMKTTKFNPEALPKATGIKFIPFYSPARSSEQKKHRSSSPLPSPVAHDRSDRYFDFSDLSLSYYSSTPVHLSQLGQSRSHLNDSSIQSVPSDNSLERSSSDPCISGHFALKKQQVLRDFLLIPRPPSKLPTAKPKLSGRVLTSLENLRMMEERELKKREDARLKEERKKVREEKRKQKEEREHEKRNKSDRKNLSRMPVTKKPIKSTSKTEGSGAGPGIDGDHSSKELQCQPPRTARGRTVAKQAGVGLKKPLRSKSGAEGSGAGPQIDGDHSSKELQCQPAPIAGGRTVSKKPGVGLKRSLRSSRVEAEGSGAGPGIDGDHSSKELQCQPPPTARGRTVSKKPGVGLKKTSRSKSGAEGSGAGPEIDGDHSSKELQCQPPRTARGRTVSKKLGVGLEKTSRSKSAKGSGAGPEIDGDHSSKELQCQPPRTARGRTVAKQAGVGLKRSLRSSRVEAEGSGAGPGIDGDHSSKELQCQPPPTAKGRTMAKKPGVGLEKNPRTKSGVGAGTDSDTSSEELSSLHADGGQNTSKRCMTTKAVSFCISSTSEDEESEDQDTLGHKNLAPLHSGGQLTSSIIACYQLLLKRKYNVGGLEDPVYGVQYEFSTQRGPFVQVLHVNGNHWIVISNMNSKPGHIQVFDSVHEEILSADTIKQTCCIVRSKRSSIKIDIMDVCQQTGTVDCGLFALAYATTLCNGELPQYKTYIQKEMRPHLIKCLQESTPTASPFPLSNRNLQHDVKMTKSVSLHCSCRLPEDPEKRMIQCVICSVWYHEDCEPVVESAWIDENYPWKCRKCAAKAK